MSRSPAFFARSYSRALRTALAATLLGASLSACVPLIVGGAVGGTYLALDRRSSGAQLDDEAIEARTHNRVESALQGRGRVNAMSYNRILLLTGQVPTEADRQLAENTAKTVPNVRSVVNEIQVGSDASVARRANDALLSTRVKTALVSATGLQSHAVKVTSEAGTVYLMGIVTAREADMASNAARDVSGVNKVVRVFEIVSESALDGSVTPTPPATSTPPSAGATAAPATTSVTTP